MDMVQVKAEVPRDLWRQFKVLLAVRDESYAQWLRDHIVATLREEDRVQRLRAAAAPQG
jgi:hypothetical protein